MRVREDDLRRTGIPTTATVPWGTHFCQFYKTRQDLLDILIPYFKAGLEDNEFCMWVTSHPLTAEDALESMRQSVGDFSRYLKRGQIEIIPHTQWYTLNGRFSADRVLKGWVDKHDQALAAGYAGLRLSGNTFWLEEKDWGRFAKYEEDVNRVIGNYRMLAACMYSVNRCGAAEVIDVVANHQFALVHRDGKWDLIESSQLKAAKTRRAENEQQEAARRQAEILDFANDSIIIFDTDGKISYWNQGAERLYSWTKAEAVGKNVHKLLKTVFPVSNPEALKTVLRTSAWEGEVTQETKAGEQVLVHSRWTLRTHPDGAPQAILEINHDVTAAWQAEQDLRAMWSYTRSLIEASIDPLVTISADGKITDVNTATEDATGVPRQKLIGSDFSDYFTEPAKARAGYKRVFSKGYVRDYPLAIRHKSGRVTDVLYNATVYRDEKDEVAGVFAAARDITERKLTQDALQKSESRLRYLSSKLLTTQETERQRIGRELHDGTGQSLAAIKFRIETVLKELDGADAGMTLDHLKAIVPLIQESIKEVRRIQRDLRPPMLDELGLLPTLNAFCDDFKETYPRIGIKRRTTMDERAISDTHKTIIFRVLQEAMNNVAKHSGADTVQVSLQSGREGIDLMVKDNGRGFDVDKAFSPKTSTGLGLTSMRERVELSGGSFSVESGLGAGTTVRASWQQ